ncbi:methyl-accepting chemotaxis protein [Paenibacillus athensensis]|uniref:Methyl-accepting chemotaxis protein n=1 Tax=Paenibacillus athensensis TaxID=1967502 RepID=A0A4Y8QB52_9BACL|nr:methyl-accepting chemotaxis protein [Paenibacillus athensensis]MCD1258936.1 methyl-accepting chemotaxis protein [Paenibacillus athensensis]
MRKKGFSITMRVKLLAGFCGLLLIFLGVAYFNWVQVNQIKAQMSDQNDKVDLKVKALELKEMVQELNIIASGLEISKKPEYILTYNAKREPYNELIKSIGDTAATPEQQKWRSQLIQASVDYINNFDTAAKMVQDPSMKPTDLEINLLYLYNESQGLKEQIFALVDKFYVTYADQAGQAVAQSYQRLDDTSRVMLFAAALVLLATVAIAYGLIRSFTRPIARLQKAVALIAAGDLRHTIGADSRDELGQLSASFDHMIVQVRHMLGNTLGIASSLSAHAESFQRFSQLTAAANTDIVRSIEEISAGAGKQAEQSETSALIIAELETDIRDIADYADDMQRSGLEAAASTRNGAESMQSLQTAAARSQEVLQRVDGAMETLGASSQQIGAIVRSISDIATQTNVLALNAAIEAARAGANGRGFSVIADEVRQLSQQTSDSSKLVAGIIQELQQQMEQLKHNLATAREITLYQNGRIGDTLAAFSVIEQAMAGMAGQVERIHLNIGHVRRKNETLVQSVQFVAAIAQETAAGVQEVNSTSIDQDAAIRRIAGESDDMYSLAQRLFAEISRFRTGDAADGQADVADGRLHGVGAAEASALWERPRAALAADAADAAAARADGAQGADVKAPRAAEQPPLAEAQGELAAPHAPLLQHADWQAAIGDDAAGSADGSSAIGADGDDASGSGAEQAPRYARHDREKDLIGV